MEENCTLSLTQANFNPSEQYLPGASTEHFILVLQNLGRESTAENYSKHEHRTISKPLA